MLQVMNIAVKNRHVDSLNVLWDTGSTISLICNSKAQELKLKGIPITLNITTVGGIERKESSNKYNVPLMDTNGCIRIICAYGINHITKNISDVNREHVDHILNSDEKEYFRYPGNTIDLLIGYDYATWHPVQVKSLNHLLVLSNIFGLCIAGNHQLKDASAHEEVINVCINAVSLSEFFSIESMGVECSPKCGGCRCGHCAPGSKDLTLREERELAIIDKNLVFVEDHFEVKYPWIKDPRTLPNNYGIAVKKLEILEKRLLKDDNVRIEYAEQIEDMLNRKVARKLNYKDISCYDGPTHYITHHAVIKRESATTPLRIVFNASLNYKGHVLNEFWAKGPDAYINNLLKILIRFRENKIAFTGDIAKMYHTIRLSIVDQHTHRFLWRY